MNAVVWLMLLVAMCFYAVGEFYSKQFANCGKWVYAALALFAYFANAALFLPTLTKFNNLTILGTIWNLGYVLITITLGILVFHEAITVKQTIGVILACIAVILLS